MEEQKGFLERVGVRDIAVIIALLLNLGGFVWSAATWVSSTRQLSIAVTELRETVGIIVSDLSSLKVEYNARISVLEDRYRRAQ